MALLKSIDRRCSPLERDLDGSRRRSSTSPRSRGRALDALLASSRLQGPAFELDPQYYRFPEAWFAGNPKFGTSGPASAQLRDAGDAAGSARVEMDGLPAPTRRPTEVPSATSPRELDELGPARARPPKIYIEGAEHDLLERMAVPVDRHGSLPDPVPRLVLQRHHGSADGAFDESLRQSHTTWTCATQTVRAAVHDGPNPIHQLELHRDQRKQPSSRRCGRRRRPGMPCRPPGEARLTVRSAGGRAEVSVPWSEGW